MPFALCQPPHRILPGPGPSMVDPRVYQAMASPLVGHTDPDFFGVLSDTSELLRCVFGTSNEFTIAVPGTGSAGMEASVVNFIEAGTRVAVFANGYFSDRFTEMCRRQRADVVRFEKPWGEILADEEAREFIGRQRPQVVMFVHAETSTGALQPAKSICDAAHECGALVIGDCVTSLAGMPVDVDANGIDIAYSGTQKCLSALPGLAPLILSAAALEKLRVRTSSCVSWCLDLKLLDEYWGESHRYHHTTPITMFYALRLCQQETLERRFERHRAFIAGIEVLGGFGPLAGKILRVGLTGASSQRNYVVLLLGALEACLGTNGAVRAAEAVYASQAGRGDFRTGRSAR